MTLPRVLQLVVAIATLGILPMGFPNRVFAQQVGLTSAQVEAIRNQVQLIQGGSTRTARVSDTLRVGDSLRTAASARAELRFNDGSLARIGERATFRFSPNTRNFQLSNGTVLLLIPPGRGQTTIQTPNTTTGIQGSGLFVRYDDATNTTVVGALTTNPAGLMQVFNQDGTQQQGIQAGEMVVLRGPDIVGVFRFDLNTFYQTSSLAGGLSLTEPPTTTDLADPVAAVRTETTDALSTQPEVSGEGVLVNPAFISLSSTTNPVVAETPLAPVGGGSVDLAGSTTEVTGGSIPLIAADPMANISFPDLASIAMPLSTTAGGSQYVQIPSPSGVGVSNSSLVELLMPANVVESPSAATSSSPSQGGGNPAGTAPGIGGVLPNPGGTPPGQGGTPPGQGGTPPGQGGTPPGQGGTPPGQGGTPPGQGGTPPGQGGTPPGQGGTPPGQGGTPPGQGGIPPGQGGTPPGQGGTPPGQGGTPPGLGGTPPGQGGTPPGQGGTPPGQGGTPPGLGGTPPGQGGTPPGQGGTPPGQGGTPPGQVP